MELKLVEVNGPTLNSMQIAAAHKPRTIGELKTMIAAMEAAWDEQDELYLGKFDDQGLYVDTPLGVANAEIIYYGEFGFITFPTSL